MGEGIFFTPGHRLSWVHKKGFVFIFFSRKGWVFCTPLSSYPFMDSLSAVGTAITALVSVSIPLVCYLLVIISCYTWPESARIISGYLVVIISYHT